MTDKGHNQKEIFEKEVEVNANLTADSVTTENIISENNGNIVLAPDGTGELIIDAGGSHTTLNVRASNNNDAFVFIGEESIPTEKYGGVIYFDGSGNDFLVGTIVATTITPVARIDRGVDALRILTLLRADHILEHTTNHGVNIEDILLKDGALTLGGGGTSINEFSIDGTLAGNSDDASPTEKATKTYVDSHPAVDADAFSAYTTGNAQQDVTGDGGSAYTSIFNTELFEKGISYDNTTGIATIDTSGIYWINVVLGLGDLTSSHTKYTIQVYVTNSGGSPIQTPFIRESDAWADSDSGGALYYSGGILLGLDTTNTVRIRVIVSGGTKIVDIRDSSYFSMHYVGSAT